VTDFHLSPEELQRIQPTLKDMAQKYYLIRHQFGADMMGRSTNTTTRFLRS